MLQHQPFGAAALDGVGIVAVGIFEGFDVFGAKVAAQVGEALVLPLTSTTRASLPWRSVMDRSQPMSGVAAIAGSP